jgi:hypothetical protein
MPSAVRDVRCRVVDARMVERRRAAPPFRVERLPHVPPMKNRALRCRTSRHACPPPVP